MKRKWIYYALTVLMGGIYMGGILDTQLVIVSGQGPWSPTFGWELMVAGFGALTYSLGSLFLASLSDRFGRLPCIAAASFLVALVNAVMGWHLIGEYRIWHFFLYWGSITLCGSVFFTGVEGLLSEYQDHSVPLARRLGLYCVSWCVGDSIGAFFTGHTKEVAGPEVVYLGLGLCALAACLMTLLDLARHGRAKLGGTDIGEADIRPEAPFHARLGKVGVFFACIAFSAISASFPRFGRDFHHFSETSIGIIISSILFAGTITFLWFPFWRRWHYNLRLQLGLQCTLLVGIFLAFIAPSGSVVLLVAGFMLFGFGWSVSYFFSIYYSLTVPTDHAKSGGLHEAVLGLGNLVGPILAVGVIYMSDTFSLVRSERLVSTAMVVAGAIAIISILVQFTLSRKTHNS